MGPAEFAQWEAEFAQWEVPPGWRSSKRGVYLHVKMHGHKCYGIGRKLGA